ncbi:MAG: carboxypeptidase regulatory-like domain-containing protein [Bryobacteraceae bacterium]
MSKSTRAILAFLVSFLSCGLPGFAQSNSGAVKGSVLDPSGAAISNATVTIQNAVSKYSRTAQTDAQGNFAFANVPFNNYHVSIAAPGFQSGEQDVVVRSSVPAEFKVTLALGETKTEVTVSEAGDLLETDSTSHTDVDRALFDKLPLESNSSSISSLVTLATPGISADSDGLFHGFGDHASNSFSVDGQPITDQQSKVFSNQIPLDSVQSMDVIAGAPPAEYGGKTSVVIVVNTRSGLGVTQPHGDVSTTFGNFATAGGSFDLAWGGQKWGNFVSASGLDTSRFLDGPEFTVMHDQGNEENVFDRIDLKPTDADSINLNLGFSRSWFQTPNSFDSQNATAWSGLDVNNGGLGPDGLPVGSQDQRSKILTYNVAPAWTHLLSPTTLLTLGAFVRHDQFNYYGSDNPYADLTPNLQTNTVDQERTLTNVGARASLSYVKGIHNIKIGATFEDTILNENDRFGIVDPLENAVCLNPDGSPNTNPSITMPGQCAGGLQPNPGYLPILAPLDLTRPTPTTGLYNYIGHADIHEGALYIQDAITLKNWTFNLGIRGDIYRGITSASAAEPRLGAAYNIKRTNTVLRVAYAYSLESPFNENLVLASLGCNDAVINALTSITQGYPCLTSALKPSTRNEYHVGLQQAFGKFLVVDAEYVWKYTNLGYDFSVLGNTPITYPIEWRKSKIPGFALRATVPEYHGFTAYVVMSSIAARFFGPQLAGIGITPTTTGNTEVFRIDHDEHFNQTTHLQYQPKKNLPWIGLNWRYDSGQVAGPVPCAGGECNNGPNGTNTIVDASILTPDQQYQAGLYCGGVYATPTTPISPNSICPASQYGSKYLTIPAAGTENNDHNPPRIAPRNLFDIAIGQDNLLRGDKFKLSARLTVVNLTDKEALYNFLSTFSGTHYVSPRAITATIGFHF